MDKDEEQGQEPKQHNNPNIIDNINNLRNLRKSMRGEDQKERVQDKLANKTKGRLEQAGKKAVGKAGKRIAKQIGKKAVVAAGQALIETAPAWGIPALIVLIIIIVIVVIFGGGQMAAGGGGTGSNACTGTCQASACTGTDIPDTTATCTDSANPICCVPQPPPGIQPPVHFYCQYDNKWETASCKINKYGCTPTSVAMILSSYGDTMWNPLSTALANNRNGCYAGGSSASDFIPWVKSLGYTVGPNLANGKNFNTSSVRSYISKGYIILGGANIRFNRTLSGSGGHAFVISNLNDSDIALVYDPTFCSSDTNYITRSFSVFGFGNPLLCNSDGCYWYWAYPIKKL